ncbi:MAG: DUF4911 domain-containing protein [Desulfitobacteriaceae bacterium]|nr:DUF4911 domain-containing protein [Desulfitobacteriaceae bacterium]MDD4345857.1 DUF4911 domain-containing protein [Desulfitobacteriaceae bacterium]MDD4401293.1 DUF4911 domain-containing protein [Desulfitobacteriaceae bacterium]
MKNLSDTKDFSDVDKLVRAKVDRKEINMLSKIVEGLGHLGVVTTLDKVEGEVLIQTTNDCWDELKIILKHMPFEIKILDKELPSDDMIVNYRPKG